MKAAGGSQCPGQNYRPQEFQIRPSGPNPTQHRQRCRPAWRPNCAGARQSGHPAAQQAKVSDPYLSQIVATLAHTSDDDKQFVLAMATGSPRAAPRAAPARAHKGKINGEVVDE